MEKEPQVRCDACHQFKTHAWVKYKHAIICLDCLCSLTAIFTRTGLHGVYESIRKHQYGVIPEVPKEVPGE